MEPMVEAFETGNIDPTTVWGMLVAWEPRLRVLLAECRLRAVENNALGYWFGYEIPGQPSIKERMSDLVGRFTLDRSGDPRLYTTKAYDVAYFTLLRALEWGAPNPDEHEVPTIGAIPTGYHGIRFRSRTEARWAVFFDQLGVKWEHEPSGYELGGRIAYLPDFWLPEFGCFWEVKGIGGIGVEKASRLASVTERPVFLALGVPQPGCEVDVYFAEGCDLGYRWCACPRCGRLGIQFQGRAERNACSCLDPEVDVAFTGDAPRIVAAYEFARSFRFWDPK